VEGTHDSSRLNRILGNTATGKLGMLRMPNGIIPSYSWEIAKSLITEDRIKWALESMAPYKSPGDDGILPVLVQHGMQVAKRRGNDAELINPGLLIG